MTTLLDHEFCYIGRGEGKRLNCIKFTFNTGENFTYWFNDGLYIVDKSIYCGYKFIVKGQQQSLDYLKDFADVESFKIIDATFTRKLEDYI